MEKAVGIMSQLVCSVSSMGISSLLVSHQVLLFSQIFPDFGVHEIILENRNDTENSEITIDRFEIQVQDDSSPAPSVRASSSSPPTPSSSSPPSPSAKHVSTGHIVGGVVGVFLLLSLFVFFIVRRRILRRQKRRLRCSFSYLKAEPFLSSHTSDFTSPSDQILSPHGQETESGLENGQGSSTPASSRPNTHSRRSRTRSRSRSRHPKRAIDAGRIIISESGQWHTA
ncbi:hypothetical protein VKT23_006618 [Stygiomarasmius scandens]|uniref:Mid2 domain-containing protein n=1 Tax=Marasmiellus scandens TaxID=2682957 RepID=A0ABR1JP65_9AGAR